MEYPLALAERRAEWKNMIILFFNKNKTLNSFENSNLSSLSSKSILQYSNTPLGVISRQSHLSLTTPTGRGFLSSIKF